MSLPPPKQRTPVQRAKASIMCSRKPIGVLVELQRARIVKLDERIGVLMGRRVEEEEVLAELIRCKRPAKIARSYPEGFASEAEYDALYQADGDEP